MKPAGEASVTPAQPATGQELAWVAGRIGPASAAVVPLWDRGFMFAEAAYEAYVGRGNVIFAYPEHQARLARTLEGISIPHAGEALAEVDRANTELLRAFGPGPFLLYVQVTGGVAARNHVLPADPHPAVYATIRPFDRAALARDQSRGVAVIARPDRRWRGATYKTTQLLPNVLAKKDARAAQADEILFIADDGVVLEGGSTNVFWVEKGVLHTPPLARNLLPGITRGLIRTHLGVPFHETEAPLARVLRADEVFLTGTTREVTPIVRIDGKPVRDGKPGPVAKELGTRLAALFDRTCPARLDP